MDDIRNCRRCGKMYNINLTRKPICPDCVKKEDEDFETARAYVKDNPGCSVQQVVDETGVSLKLILKFLKEKRLELFDVDGEATFYLECEKCGTPISSGRLCNTCLSKLGREMLSQSSLKKFPSSTRSTSDQKGTGMHYKKGEKE